MLFHYVIYCIIAEYGALFKATNIVFGPPLHLLHTFSLLASTFSTSWHISLCQDVRFSMPQRSFSSIHYNQTFATSINAQNASFFTPNARGVFLSQLFHDNGMTGYGNFWCVKSSVSELGKYNQSDDNGSNCTAIFMACNWRFWIIFDLTG